MKLTKLGWVGAMTLSSLLALPLAQAQDKKTEPQHLLLQRRLLPLARLLRRARRRPRE